MSYRRGTMIFDPVDPAAQGVFGIQQEANRVAMLNGDTIRTGISWADVEPTQGGYTTGGTLGVQRLIDLVDTARAYRPGLKVVPHLDGVPPWIYADYPGYGAANGHYVTNQTAYSWYGYACSYILAALGDRADFIELSNEPNTTIASNGSGTEIPVNHYSGMAAYATYWINGCLGLGKAPLVGAMATGQNASYLEGSWQGYLGQLTFDMALWFYIMYPPDTYGAKWTELNQQWRISFHPYPHLGQRDNNRNPTNPDNPTGDRTGLDASNTVFAIVDDAISRAGGRMLWITETGVSEWKVGASGQAYFASLLHNRTLARPQLEGVLWFPLNDADPLAFDQSTPFHRFGTIWRDNMTYKPAANTLTSLWGTMP